MTRAYLLLGVVLALGCASCDREKQQSSTQPSTSPQAAVPATATVADRIGKKNSPATQRANIVTSPDGAAEFKPDDLKRLTREHVRWIGSVTKVDTAKKRIEVLLYSQSDAKGNEKVFIAVVTPPDSGIVNANVGDKVTVEGMLGDQFLSETQGVFKGFDQIGRTTITVPCTFAQKGMRNALSLETPATKPAAPELNRPGNAEIEKLITDGCIADRPSLEGYTAQINIKNVTADPQDKGKFTVTADVAFVSDGTRLRLGYIDHFVISRDVKNAWSIEIIKTK